MAWRVDHHRGSWSTILRGGVPYRGVEKNKERGWSSIGIEGAEYHCEMAVKYKRERGRVQNSASDFYF